VKTLLEKPKLQIDPKEDGVWLHFQAAGSLSASINLSLFGGKGIIGEAVRQWAIEYAAENPK